MLRLVKARWSPDLHELRAIWRLNSVNDPLDGILGRQRAALNIRRKHDLVPLRRQQITRVNFISTCPPASAAI